MNVDTPSFVGAYVTLSQNGLEELKSIALPIIMQQLQHLTVPDIEVQIGIRHLCFLSILQILITATELDTVIGTITLWVTHITIKGITFTMDVTIAPNQGITGSVYVLSLSHSHTH
jgi:hypothetical protein